MSSMADPIGYTPPQSVTIAPWLQPLVQRESGGRWDVVNPYGYSGFLQFGEAAAAQAGVYGGDDNLRDNRWGGTFTLPSGRYSYQEWLNSPQAQIETGDAHFGGLDRELERLGLSRYLGQTVNGVPVTREGLLYGAHLGGLGGLKRWLEGRGNPADANGTRVGDYVAMGAQAAGAGGAPQMAMQPPQQPQQGPGGPQHMGILDALAGTPPQPQGPARGIFDMLLWGDPDGIGMQAGLSAARALLQAGAPSTDPRHGSFGYALGEAFGGLAEGQERGMRMAEQNRLSNAREQTERMISALPPETQALARMDPAAFARIMLERQFAGPPEPIHAGGGLFVDPNNPAHVLADHRAPDTPSAVQQYEYARQQGYQGTFMDYQEATGSGVNVNNYGSIPQGYEIFTDPQTGATQMRVIPGSPADLEQQAAAEAAQAQQALTARSGGIVLDEINRAMGLLDENVNFTAGPGASVGMLWPSSQASQLNSLLETVKANIGFDRLQQMREASPTGGALGAVSDRELGTLQAVSGTLDITGDPQMLQENLQRLWNAYMDAIHGTPDQIRALGAQRGMSEQEIEQLTYRYPAPAGAGRGVPALPAGTMPAAPSVQGGAYPAAADIGRMTPSDLQGLLPLINDQMPPDLLRAIERRMDELGM